MLFRYSLDRAINVLPRGLFFTRTALTDRVSPLSPFPDRPLMNS